RHLERGYRRTAPHEPTNPAGAEVSASPHPPERPAGLPRPANGPSRPRAPHPSRPRGTPRRPETAPPVRRWPLQAEAAGAGGPGAPPLIGSGDLGDGDLFLAGGQVGAGGVAQAALTFPGALVELDAAVVAVAGVDRPVAVGLAFGQRVPEVAVADGRDLGARLGALADRPRLRGHLHHRVDRGALDLLAVDLGDGEGHVLHAGDALVLDDGAAHVQRLVLDDVLRRVQGQRLGDVL